MLQAWGYEFTDLGEQHKNHCRRQYPTTTHVVKVLFSGPPTTDGVHPLTPEDVALFTVGRGPDADQARVITDVLQSSRFLGLADLGTNYRNDGTAATRVDYKDTYQSDGDNYVDLCF